MKLHFALSLSALLSIHAAQAGLILSEDFETLNNGVQLYVQLNTFESTGQNNGAADYLVGQAYSSGAPGTGFNGQGGSNAVLFDKSAGTTNLRLRQDADFDLGVAYNGIHPHKVSFDFYSDSTTAQNGNFRLFMTDGTGSLSDGLDLGFFSSFRQVRNLNTGTPFAVAGNGFGQLKSDTWYRYELLINPLTTANDTYDLTVYESGVSSAVITETGLAFNTDIANISRMEFQMFNSGGTSRAFFDNINVAAIPEPSTSILLTSGLAAFSFLRRRRRSVSAAR